MSDENQLGLALEDPTAIACGPRRRRDLQREFEEWLASKDGRAVYVEAVSRARRLLARGYRHYSMDALYHSIRFDWSVKVGPDADGFKLNDHHTSRLARRIMADFEDLAGFFETRQLRGGP